MAGGTFFTRWLMFLATTNPPAGREDWARAMRAEFDTLEHGRAGWAFGCLSASLGWRLQANGWIWAAILAVAVFPRDLAVWPVLTRLLAWQPHLFRPLGYAFHWGPLALACMILAAIRPRSWVVIGLATPLISAAAGLVKFTVLFHRHLAQMHGHVWGIHLMDAQLDVGVGALLGYSLVGALLGQSLGRHLRQPAPDLKPS